MPVCLIACVGGGTHEPDLGIRLVLLVIPCLLIEPCPESALNEEAGKLLLDAYEDYAKHTRLMTSIHAQPAKRWPPHPSPRRVGPALSPPHFLSFNHLSLRNDHRRYTKHARLITGILAQPAKRCLSLIMHCTAQHCLLDFHVGSN